MVKQVLITGAQGFVGSHLLPALRSDGWAAEGPAFDILDYPSLLGHLKSRPWDFVIHLAGISHVPTCERDPATAVKVNVAGTALLIEAMSAARTPGRLVFASTAQVYAAPTGEELDRGVTIAETRAVHPQNLYAQTKWNAELLIRDASARKDLIATTLRFFNHTHRSQSTDFFLPHVYSLLKKAGPGSEVVVPVGNLDLYRYLGAVSDLVRAVMSVLSAAKAGRDLPDAMNVCTGTPKLLKSLAEGLAKRMGVRARFESDPARIRKDEARSIIGSHDRITQATGWKPRLITEEAVIEDFLF